MKIYNVIIDDRHNDIEVVTFANKDKSIKFARNKAKDLCYHPEDFEEHSYTSWLYHASYSCEDDCVFVVESDLII